MALENVEFISLFPNDSTVWIIVFVKDKDGELVDPTNSILLSLWDPAGVIQVEDAEMTKYESETGIYNYFYHTGEDAEPMDKGEWTGKVKVIDGSGESAIVSSSSFSFRVE